MDVPAHSQPDDTLAEVDETFDRTLDFNSIIDPAHWKPPGEYYQMMPAATRAAVNSVVESDEQLRQTLRAEVFPDLRRTGGLLEWKRADERYIESLQQKQLYTGKVVASDGTLAKYETLSLVGAQIAISRVSYQGNTGQIVSNIMHWGRELPRNITVDDILSALRSRGAELKDKVSNVFLYALMTYKEREVLLETPPGTFKLIQGSIFPYEMLSGSGRQHTLLPCLTLIGQMIDDGTYATIVSHDSHRELLALGMALDAREYIVTDTGSDVLAQFGRNAHYTRTKIAEYGGRSQMELFNEFAARYGPKVLRGVLRAHPLSPPYVFYCSADRLDEAVHTLLADAANTGARGFPLLVDLADQYCSGAFRAGEYTNHVNAEFARASGGSGIYQAERTTRD
jgi:hypothetical protein